MPITTDSSTSGAIRLNTDFTANSLAWNDDFSTGQVPLGFTVNFFGTNYSQCYINNNGNITFDAAVNTYVPYGLTGSTAHPIIAAFLADVDTRNPYLQPVPGGGGTSGSGSIQGAIPSGVTVSKEVTWGSGTVDGHTALGVNWVGVGEYAMVANTFDSFQLVLINRADTGNSANFDIELNYGGIQWDTAGSQSGHAATVGYSNGSGTAGTNAQLAGSLSSGSFLDSNTSTGLAHNSLASSVTGRYLFQVRNGIVLITPPQLLTAVPSATSVSLSWLAPANVPPGSSVTYNVYRGLSHGQESLTPIATMISGGIFQDMNVSVGSIYYYYVTASVILNGTTNLSGASNEASATPYGAFLLLQDAYTSVDGGNIYLVFSDNGSEPMQPSPPTQASGLSINRSNAGAFNGGVVISSALRLSSSGSGENTFTLSLAAPIQFGDVITFSYAGGNISDSSSHQLPGYMNQPVRNLVAMTEGPFFDPLPWLSFEVDPAQGNLLERRIGFSSASVILDTTPPGGEVILNENPGSGGVLIHCFSATNSGGTAATGFSVMQDALGNTIRQAGALGGASNVNAYEVIGDGNSRDYVTYFSVMAGVYPVLATITVGVTALRAKQYAVDIQQSHSPTWITLFTFLADPQLTQDYLQYALPANVSVSAMRVRYRGDFYAPSELGTLTASATDALSGVVALQLAHYSDFRDAADFPGADSTGWAAFTEGVSVFDWSLINQKRLWAAQPGTASGSLKLLIAFNSSIAAFTSSGAYSLTPGGTLTPASGFPSSGAAVSCAAVYNNNIYVGLASGYILVGASASSFTVLNPSAQLPPITAMAYYAGKLWIACGANSLGQSQILSWDGKTLANQRTLQQQGAQHTVVTALTAVGTRLFTAVAGDVGSSAGGVYVYDGISWTLNFSANDTDSVDTLAYSTETGALWAGLEGGQVYSLGFDATGTPKTWTKVYDGDAAHYLNFVDGGSGFFWLVSAGELVTYVADTTGTPIFASVLQPLTAMGMPTITDIAYAAGQAYGSGTDGSLYLLDTSTIATNKRTVYARFRDAAGNTTSVPGTLTDDILRTTQQNSVSSTGGGTARVSDGYIYQIAQDKSVVVTLTSSAPLALYAPSRVLEQTGIYESEPFYVATLSRWDKISFIASLPAPITAPPGLNSGAEVDLYVRAADTRSECLSQAYGLPFTRGSIKSPVYTGLVDTATTMDFNISSVSGRWLQYKIVITAAQQGADPNVHAVTLSYLAAQAAYFFTSVFDTSVKVNGGIPPQFRRGLLTANCMPNGGQVVFGYTTDTQAGNTFDFSKYTQITPNTVFELPQPLSAIRFGILLTSTSTVTPAIVDNFAVQVDVGETDIHWMA